MELFVLCLIPSRLIQERLYPKKGGVKSCTGFKINERMVEGFKLLFLKNILNFVDV